MNGPRVVALGGGHGLATSLRAARYYAGELTGIVSVADDGGSSGRLRRELGMRQYRQEQRRRQANRRQRETMHAINLQTKNRHYTQRKNNKKPTGTPSPAKTSHLPRPAKPSAPFFITKPS